MATPVPSPLIPVDTGKPVAFVSVPEAGIPRIGATKVCCPAQLCAVENTSALSMADVTFVAPMVAANDPEPVPVTSPVKVMV